MSKTKVLIITKESSLLNSLTENIEKYNFEIHESHFYTKALAILAHEKIDLLFIDLSFRKQFKKEDTIKGLSKYSPLEAPFIFFIANDTDFYIIEDTKIPQTYYRIEKPYSVSELEHAIELILTKE